MKKNCNCKQHSINFRAKLSLIRTIWYRFDCNGYCLSSRFHLSRVIIVLQVFRFPTVARDEFARMNVASWIVSRKFRSITKQLAQLTMPRSPLFLRHVFVLIIKCIVLRLDFRFFIPREIAQLKTCTFVACFHLSYFCSSSASCILLCKEKRSRSFI